MHSFPLTVAGWDVDLQRSDERAIGLRGHVDSFGERLGLIGVRHLHFLSRVLAWLLIVQASNGGTRFGAKPTSSAPG
jgi:hypothetical protein